MKRLCKNIDITNRDFIKAAFYDCITDKYNRVDVAKYLANVAVLPHCYLHVIYYRYGKAAMIPFIELAIDEIRAELLNENLKLIPIRYFNKTDPSSGKVRNIGIQDFKQQVYDYIAVRGMKELIKRIGEYQCGVISPRGQIWGAKTIKRWLQNKQIRYGAKADIKKCYESIDKKRLMAFLERHIKNPKLLWLINELIYTFNTGISIGSYLSQYLCALYLSQLYHEIAENMYRMRNSRRDGRLKRVNLVKHQIFYCDDILILGTNAKDIHLAMMKIIKYAKDKLELSIKLNWYIFNMNNVSNSFIDMMGYRIYRNRITIRRSTFLRIRRCYIRAWRYLRIMGYIPLKQAQRCVSYYGWLKNSNSRRFIRRYHIKTIIRRSKKTIKLFSKKEVTL